MLKMRGMVKRVETLEKVTAIGTDGMCICRPPSEVRELRQSEAVFSDVKLADEPLPDLGRCARCSGQRHLLLFRLEFDPVTAGTEGEF